MAGCLFFQMVHATFGTLGIIHPPTEYVLSAGRFVDQAPFAHRYDWMRISCQSTRARAEDNLKIPDDFFRHDNGVTDVHPPSFLG